MRQIYGARDYNVWLTIKDKVNSLVNIIEIKNLRQVVQIGLKL